MSAWDRPQQSGKVMHEGVRVWGMQVEAGLATVLHWVCHVGRGGGHVGCHVVFGQEMGITRIRAVPKARGVVAMQHAAGTPGDGGGGHCGLAGRGGGDLKLAVCDAAPQHLLVRHARLREFDARDFLH